MAKKLKDDISMFEYIVDPAHTGCDIMDNARDILIESLNCADLKTGLSAVNALRQLEETNLKHKELKIKNDKLTIDSDDFVSIEALVKRIGGDND